MNAKLGQRLFEYRSYTPIPFLIVMIIFARPTLTSILIGFFIVICGEAVRMWGVSIVGSETRTTGAVGGTYLVTKGPYAYVRNPLYLGNMIMHCGFGVMSLAIFPWLVIAALLFFILQYSLIVRSEEDYLAKRFGDEYERYRQSVPRFIPSLKKYLSGNAPQPDFDWKRGIKSEKRTLQAIAALGTIVAILGVVRG